MLIDGLYEFSGEDLANLSLDDVHFDPVAGVIVAGLSAVVESPEIAANDFDQLIVSWNAHTPAGCCLSILAQVRISGDWSPWYKMGLWSTSDNPWRRTSFNGQDDAFASVQTDTLVLKKHADAFKIRIGIHSSSCGDYPQLRLLAVNVIDSTGDIPNLPPNKQAWGVELDVPEISQLSVSGGKGWCSAASLAMVLGYWSKKLNRADLAVGITEAACAIHDEAWNGTGNWVFNTAYAGEFSGMRAVVTRFNCVTQIEECILAGTPVVASLNYRRLNPDETTSGGHLMVIRGFTSEGDPIFNDPWTRPECGLSVRKIFSRSALEDSWLGSNGSFGTVYLIRTAR